jgi:hypothetical protein
MTWLRRFVERVACGATPAHRRFRRDVLILLVVAAAVIVWRVV